MFLYFPTEQNLIFKLFVVLSFDLRHLQCIARIMLVRLHVLGAILELISDSEYIQHLNGAQTLPGESVGCNDSFDSCL